MSLRDEAYEKSLALLRNLSTQNGFLASREHIDNYERIWARDGVIAGIAALLTHDNALITTFKRTLETLYAHQDETGRIPSNVAPKTGATSYGTTVGRVDATLWYVIGVCAIARIDNDRGFFDAYHASVEKALFYLRCLELNGRGLLYIPQGGDWADEYINHGYVLYDEVLYYFALATYSRLTGDKTAKAARERLGNLIRVNYFPSAKRRESIHVYNHALYDYAINTYTPPLPASYFTNHSIRFNVDTFSIGLLLLSDIVDAEQATAIRTSVEEELLNNFPILPAFHPIITEGDPLWEDLKLNFLYEFRNKPNEYHNGGLWPLVHGFFISSRSKNKKAALDAFAQALARDEYTFPEYYHGETFTAMGTPGVAFSAASYLIAYTSLIRGNKLFRLLTA